MTREEQIRNKAIDFSEDEDNFLEYDDCGDTCDDKLFVERAFISGAKWADEGMIKKACEWLENNIDPGLIIYHEKKWLSMKEFINNFKEAMQNERRTL